MNKIAKFLKATKHTEIKDNIVFVFGTEKELDQYIDFFDDNDWVYVNPTSYKKPVPKLTERDKRVLKVDFFLNADHEIKKYYKTLDTKFDTIDHEAVAALNTAFQFNMKILPYSVKKIIKKLKGHNSGLFYVVKFEDMSKQNLKEIIDQMHRADYDIDYGVDG